MPTSKFSKYRGGKESSCYKNVCLVFEWKQQKVQSHIRKGRTFLVSLYQCFKNWTELDSQTGPIPSTVWTKGQTNESDKPPGSWRTEWSNIPFQLSLSFKLIFHVLWIFGKRSSPLYGPHPTLNQLMGCILSPHDVDMPLAWLPMWDWWYQPMKDNPQTN